MLASRIDSYCHISVGYSFKMKYYFFDEKRSLGITALEMAEGKAPYGEIHPMRAIFMIPTKPPPSFNNPDKWSSNFIEFVSRCLVKNPEERASASELLQHEFIRTANPTETLREMIAEAQEIKEQLQSRRLSVVIIWNYS